MNYGFIRDGICTNAAVFTSEKDVLIFMKATKDLECYDYDDIVGLEEGFGIGDLYQDDRWIKPPMPETPPETMLVELDRVHILEQELAAIKEQLSILLENAL